MMSIKTVMETVRSELAVKLPPLIQAEGLKDIGHFTVGYPANQEQTFCCVRVASLEGKKQLEFIIHLALPAVGELEAYGYMQAVIAYLEDEFDQTAYGFDTGDYELQIFETDFTHGDMQILFSVTLNRIRDDCT
jgi:hypothetical protein